MLAGETALPSVDCLGSCRDVHITKLLGWGWTARQIPSRGAAAYRGGRVRPNKMGWVVSAASNIGDKMLVDRAGQTGKGFREEAHCIHPAFREGSSVSALTEQANKALEREMPKKGRGSLTERALAMPRASRQAWRLTTMRFPRSCHALGQAFSSCKFRASQSTERLARRRRQSLRLT